MRTIAIIISLLTGYVAKPQDSLSFYLTIAAKNNPTVLQNYNEYQAALQKVLQVGSLPDPELNLGVFLSPMELVSGNQVADFRLMQMFPWFGTLRAAKDEMRMMANAKYQSFRDAKSEVLYKVHSTWYDLYKVGRNIEISERNMDILGSIEKLALIKFQSSSDGSSLAHVYSIQLEMGELENNTALLKNQLRMMVAQFNGLLNRPPESSVFLPDTLVTDSLEFSLLAVSDSIHANNPLLHMLNYERKSLESRKKMVTKMGYPMLGVGLNYSVINKNEMSASAMNGKDMVMPMVTITLPVYRKKYSALQLEAELMSTATELNYTATANSLTTESYQAVQFYQDALRRITLYTNQALLSGKSLDLMIGSFAVSGSGLTEMLRVRQQALEYEYKRVEAIADYHTSIAWLKRLVAYQEIQ